MMATVEHRKNPRALKWLRRGARPGPLEPMEKPMNAIVSQIARRTSLSTLAALALAAASSSAVSAQNAAKMEVWTVNMAKSTFNSTSGTLVLEQSKAAPDVDAKGYPAAHTFLLLSSGKLYLATED